MHKLIAFLVLLIALFSGIAAYARGGQAADDCPPGTTDPDCIGGGK
jgi:hypothetical protein